jgi:hypothetical protein
MAASADRQGDEREREACVKERDGFRNKRKGLGMEERKGVGLVI